MYQRIFPLIVAAVCGGFALANSAQAQGSLIPPGGPTNTMKTLDQIYAKLDARIPITNSGATFTISQPGSYYLTTNLTVSTGGAISIATNDVTLDLNGYTIFTTTSAQVGTAIALNTGWRNLVIRNGIIHSGVTNANGVYLGPGFLYGIYGTGLTNVTVSGVTVSGVDYAGILLSTNNSTLVENCVVMTAGSYGIEASTVKDSIASDCGNTAIYGDQVADCRGISTGVGNGIQGVTVNNCYGLSSGNIGLNAYTAENCYGQCTGAYAGLYAFTAQNCTALSAGSTGISADNALNCYGYDNAGSGPGVSAVNMAQNCYGYSYNGYGVYSGSIAIGCVGVSTYNYGLYVSGIANSCVGTSSHVAGENVTYKYNMN